MRSSSDQAVDCLILNDAELRQLTGERNLLSAARESSVGPGVVVAKQGSYGAALSPPTVFGVPAFPLESVVDPTGAGDTFAGWLRRLRRAPASAG